MFLYAVPTDPPLEGWHTTTDDTVHAELKAGKWAHLSIYGYSDEHNDDLDYDKVQMDGDLVFDLDAPDLAEAIDQAQRLLIYLRDGAHVDLNLLKIYASGGKGFHIIIPHALFEKKVGIPRLNMYHKQMALMIAERAGLKQLDEGPYARRHLLRVPGRQRPDGRWKTRCTPEQVLEMTPDKYVEWVSAPRELPVLHGNWGANAFNNKLNDFWKKAQKQVKEILSARAGMPCIANEALDIFTDNLLPPCVVQMRDQVNVHHGEGQFNKQAMNMAAFLDCAGNVSDAKKEEIANLFIENFPARTPADRARHAYGLRSRRGSELSFSCTANKRCLNNNPCTGCPMMMTLQELAVESTNITAGPLGLFAETKAGQVQLTDFTIQRERAIVAADDLQGLRIEDEYALHVIRNNREYTKRLIITPSEWADPKAFTTKIAQAEAHHYCNAAMLGRLHSLTLSDEDLVERIVETKYCGIQFVDEKAVWVDPTTAQTGDASIARVTYGGNVVGIPVKPILGHGRINERDTASLEFMHNLLHSNYPEKVAQMLGWAGACHLKAHLRREGYEEFPLLHISGIPGAGKTQSALVYSALTGAKVEGPITAGAATMSPLRQALSSTTTVARVYDEFNKGNLGMDRYQKVQEYLKVAYNGQNVAIGMLGSGKRGPATRDELALAPIIYMAKETTEMEELLQRSIVVRVDKKDHNVNRHCDYFEKVRVSLYERGHDAYPAARWAKSLIFHALQQEAEEIAEQYLKAKQDIGVNGHNRLTNNLAIVLMGLRHVMGTLKKYVPGEKALQELLQLREQQVIAFWRQEAKDREGVKVRGIVEEVLKQFSVMARTGEIQVNIHYAISGNTLYIDPIMCLSPYRTHCFRSRLPFEFTSGQSLATALKGTEYYLGSGTHSGDPESQDWIALDLSVLRDYGIYKSHFKE